MGKAEKDSPSFFTFEPNWERGKGGKGLGKGGAKKGTNP